MKKIVTIVVVFCSFFTFSADWVSTGRVLWVDGENGNDATAVSDDESLAYKTINAAVLAMKKEDIVKIKPGTYTLTESITNSPTLSDYAHLTFMGSDPNNRPVINGDGKHIGFVLSGIGMLFKDLIVSNCYTENPITGGAAGMTFKNVGWGSLTDKERWRLSSKFVNCKFVANTNMVSNPQHGSSGAVAGKLFFYYDCDFIKNYGASGGALFSYHSQSAGGMIVSNCYFEGNSASYSGGAAFIPNYGGSKGHFYDSTFVSNVTRLGNGQDGQGGGAIMFYYTGGTVKGCKFIGNETMLRGGAIHVRETSVTIDGCEFDGNKAGLDPASNRKDGCAIGRYSTASYYIYNSIFKNHEVGCNVIELVKTSIITNCLFENNAQYSMSLALASDNLTVKSCVFANNSAPCIYIAANQVTNYIDSCVFTNNSTTTYGTVYYVQKNKTGGYIRNSLFAGNMAANGGALYYVNKDDGSLLTVENCTIANNTASSRGGGVYLGDSSDGQIVLKNTIISSNSVSGAGYQNEANVKGPSTENVFVNCFVGGDAKFKRGSYLLRADSPCRDAGIYLDWMDADSVDLNGRERVVNGTVDIGAYEWFSISGLSVFIK